MKSGAYSIYLHYGQCKKKRISKNINHDYFKIIDTEDKAYLLGFILADGCIQKKYGVNTISFHNSIEDISAIELFKNKVAFGNKLCFRKNNGKKDTVSIKGSSSIIIEDLSKFNILPNKTYDFNFEFPFEKIPNNLLRHFIRGFFDGDGTFTQNRFEFITTSLKFANQIINIICLQLDVDYRIRERKTKNVIEYMFYFKSKKISEKSIYIKKLYDWLYKDSKYFFRKKKI